jgi:hypothetical protein
VTRRTAVVKGVSKLVNVCESRSGDKNVTSSVEDGNQGIFG